MLSEINTTGTSAYCPLPTALNNVHCFHKESANKRQDQRQIFKMSSNSKNKRRSRC